MRVVTPDAVATAAAAVDAGQLVVVPTSRWYMLCGRADESDVCGRIFRAKRRPTSRQLLLAAPSVEAVRESFVLGEAASALVGAFWPGDLALVLPWRRPADGQRLASVGTTAALVAQPAGVLGELAQLARYPIASTSANISPASDSAGTPPALTLDEARAFVDAAEVEVAVVVDGGVCPHSCDTSIVDCVGPAPVLRREGIVRTRALAAVLTAAGIDLIVAD